MARNTEIIDPLDEREHMKIMCANTWQDLYRQFGIVLAVNDGRYLTRINDREDEKYKR